MSPSSLAMSSCAKAGQPWIVAEHHLYPRYYCQRPVARSIQVKKQQNEGCSKFVFTKQTSCPGTIGKRIYLLTLIIIADESWRVKCQQELSIFGCVLTSSLLVGVGYAPFSPKGQAGEKPWFPTDYNAQRQGQVRLTALPQKTTASFGIRMQNLFWGFLPFLFDDVLPPSNLFSPLFCEQQAKALQHMGMVHQNDSDGGQWSGEIPKSVRILSSGVQSQDNTMSVLCIYFRKLSLVGMTIKKSH